LIPLGEADVKREGRDVTVVALSNMVPKALEAAEELASEVSVEVVDPRTLVPLDVARIAASVRKTGRLLVAHEAPVRGGVGAEIVRRVVEEAFDCLDAPPKVLGGLNTPIPFSPTLEDVCVPTKADILTAIGELVSDRR
jgi:pyruvate dehydrogenase E1 component beta subunit